MVPKNYMKKSNAPPAQIETVDLELPDWTGMGDSSQRISREAAFELCEQYARQFPEARRQHLLLGRNKCIVPFVLGPE